MKRITRLTERDLTRIVKRVINESLFFKGNSNWDNFNSRRRPHINLNSDEKERELPKNSLHDVANHFYGVDFDELNRNEKDHILDVYKDYKYEDLNDDFDY